MKKELIAICTVVFLLVVMATATADKGGIPPWQTMIEERLDNVLDDIYDDLKDRLESDFPILVDTSVPEEIEPEFYVDAPIESDTPIEIQPHNPFWYEINSDSLVLPRGRIDYLLGVKLTANASVNQTCQNCELLLRIRLDLEDGRSFYTMWIRFNETDPTVIITQERISNIIHDYRWATGNHDLGLVLDQDYYNITFEGGVSLANATIHSHSVEVFYLLTTPAQT